MIDGEDVTAFTWTQINEFLMWSSSNKVAMGGGGEGIGFVLDDDFRTGSTSTCESFANPPLVNTDVNAFNILNVEVWGFISSFARNKSIKIVRSLFGSDGKNHL